MAYLFDEWIDITPSTAGEWVDTDLSSYVTTSEASGVILQLENTSGTVARTVGAKMHTSEDDIKNSIRDGSQTVFFIGVDASNHVDLYVENATDVKVYLVGYFTTDAVFFQNAVEKTPTNLSQWEDQTIDDAADGAIGCFWIIDGVNASCGLMEKGSTLDNFTYSMELKGAFVGIDSNKKAQNYKTSASQHFYVVGYIKSGEGNIKLDANVQLNFAGHYNEWWTFDLETDIPNTTRTVAVLLRVFDTTTNNTKVDARHPGITHDHFRGLYNQGWVVAKLAAWTFDGKEQSADSTWRISGYFFKPELDEEREVIATAVVEAEDDRDEQDVVITSEVDGLFDPEIADVTAVGVIESEAYQTFYESREFSFRAAVSSIVADPAAPAVKGMKPMPGETAIPIVTDIQFYIGCPTDDDVDLDSLNVVVNSTAYDKNSPELKYSYVPESNCYLITIGPLTFTNEATVNVSIDATSMLGVAMATKAYSFQTIWTADKTRSGKARIEIYPASDYSGIALTIQENWVRQGVARYTPLLEIWYGRFQDLPYVENIEMRMIAGGTNSQGKEILDNGWFSILIDGGSWVPIYEATRINLGPMFTHTHKDLYLKLDVPITAQTTKYTILEFAFEIQTFFPYGRFHWGLPMWGNSGNVIQVHPLRHFYRAYILNTTMWQQLEDIGFMASPFYRGDDHQW